MSFLVLNRHEAETAVLDVPYLVISVTDPERDEATLAESPNRRAVLRLRFHDTCVSASTTRAAAARLLRVK